MATLFSRPYHHSMQLEYLYCYQRDTSWPMVLWSIFAIDGLGRITPPTTAISMKDSPTWILLYMWPISTSFDTPMYCEPSLPEPITLPNRLVRRKYSTFKCLGWLLSTIQIDWVSMEWFLQCGVSETSLDSCYVAPLICSTCKLGQGNLSTTGNLQSPSPLPTLSTQFLELCTSTYRLNLLISLINAQSDVHCRLTGCGIYKAVVMFMQAD